LVDAGGFELETAGVLKEGRKLWALAKTGQEVMLKGNDLVKGYLLLATACDGTLATTAQFTSIRVVCNNTLTMAVGNERGAIKVSHSTVFDAAAVKKNLGLGVSVWQDFMYRIRQMANQKVSEAQAKRFLVDIFGDPSLPVNEQPREKVLAKVYDLYTSKAIGSDLASSHGTAWGLVNAVTEYVDHQRRSRAPDSRLHSAWFGQGAVIKQRTFEEAMKLAA
jgi:phage/plasmid-like protein (TIGR03299 family)